MQGRICLTDFRGWLSGWLSGWLWGGLCSWLFSCFGRCPGLPVFLALSAGWCKGRGPGGSSLSIPRLILTTKFGYLCISLEKRIEHTNNIQSFLKNINEYKLQYIPCLQTS